MASLHIEGGRSINHRGEINLRSLPPLESSSLVLCLPVSHSHNKRRVGDGIGDEE